MRETKEKNNWIVVGIFALAIILRVVLACNSRGFLTDVNCFYSWALRAYEGGLSNFYAPDVFTDYPPGYIYVLYGVGALLKLFQVEYLSAACLFIVKLPAMFCDMVAGVLLYRLASKKFGNVGAALCMAAYLCNPTILQNSAIWGQVDAVFMLCVISMCLLFMERKPVPAYFVFAVGILMKPQTLIFAPLVLYGILDTVFLQEFSWKKFWVNLISGLAAIGMMALLCLPFGLGGVIDLYTSTMGSYEYVTVNAYNFWAMLGLDWVSQEELFLGLVSYKTVGTFVILLICVLSALLFVKRKKEEDRYFVIGAFIIVTMFLFSVRMHERYLFPVLLLLIFAYAVARKREYLQIYILFSIFHFLNVWHVLKYYDPQTFDRNAASILWISLGTCVVGAYLYKVLWWPGRVSQEGERGLKVGEQVIDAQKEGNQEDDPQADKQQEDVPQAGKMKVNEQKFNRIDLLSILVICLVFGIITFINLGSMHVPQSIYEAEAADELMLQIPDGESVSSISAYIAYKDGDMNLGVFQWNEALKEWEHVQDITYTNVYSWKQEELVRPLTGNMCLMVDAGQRQIGEIVLFGEQGNVVTPINSEDYPELFDEEEMYPEEISFLNSTYFDEIYYTRVAHEFENGIHTYECTHPPFGKILMTLSTKLWGKTPFGFRFAGAFLGILMLPFVYLLGKNICKNRKLGLFAAIVFAFDFMHFTQTRITTIDVYITFFVILMFYFMEQYTRTDFLKEPLSKTFLPLGLSGISFGFGIASKWTGFYAGAGLAIIFFSVLIARFLESRQEYVVSGGSPGGYFASDSWKLYFEKLWKTGAFCVGFFILIPSVIYTLCYIPFRSDDYSQGLLKRMWENQKYMLWYHGNLDATHPYSSSWYDWPLMNRPILYYTSDYNEELTRGISAFGNPLIWWIGIPAFVFMLYLLLKKRDRVAGILAVGYLAEYLPWFFVTRCTFIYHYFPSTPFVVLMITYAFGFLPYRTEKGRRAKLALMLIYLLGVIGLFALFYPVLSGAPVSREFVDTFLRWKDSWVLVI